MGQSIGWYRVKENGGRSWAMDAPDHFDMRFEGRWLWFKLILDHEHETRVTGDTAVIRPKDFAAFRERMRAEGMLTPDGETGPTIFAEMTDWLEKHPDVYVEYS